MTKEELTVEECVRWLKKLETLSSEGAKLAHLKGILTKATTLATEAERERWIRDITAVGGKKYLIKVMGERNYKKAILDKEEGV